MGKKERKKLNIKVKEIEEINESNEITLRLSPCPCKPYYEDELVEPRVE